MKTPENITTTATSSQSCGGDWLWTPTKNIPDSLCNMEITACGYMINGRRLLAQLL